MDTTSPTANDEASAAIRARQMRQTELLISAILRGGVLLAGGVILFGMLVFFIQHIGETANSAIHLRYPHTLGEVFAGIGHGDAVAIIVLGLLLLIATPVTRIAVSILAFAVERDWRYVAITSLVLLILIVSFALGKAGG